MIDRINHYAFTNPASIHDEEALTALELAGRTASKVNECVNAVNEIDGKIETEIDNRIESGEFAKDIEKHTAAITEAIKIYETDLENELNTTKQTMLNNMNTLQKNFIDKESELETQLNTFLSSASPEDGEIVDIRVGHDNFTHTSAGAAVRDQIRAIQHNFAVLQDNILITFDNVNKIITMKPKSNTGSCIIIAEKGYWNRAANQLTNITCNYSGASGAYALVFNKQTNVLSIDKMAGNSSTGGERRTYGDIILAIIQFNNTGIASFYSIIEDMFVLDNVINKNTIINNGPTIAIDIKDINININESLKAIELTPVNGGHIWFNYGCYLSITNLTSISFNNIDVSTGKTLAVYYKNGSYGIRDVSISSAGINEQILFMMLFTNGKVSKVIANDNILRNVTINGENYILPGEVNNTIYFDNAANIFENCLVIGDSYAAGHIRENANMYNYSWPHYYEKLSGATMHNISFSGAASGDYEAFINEFYGAKYQAVFVGLMINDVMKETPVGTIDDFWNQTAGTFYGNLGKLYSYLASTTKYIFIFTCPRKDTRFIPYNEAVVNITNECPHFRLLDLRNYMDLIDETSRFSDGSGHMTAAGYNNFAYVVYKALNDYINNSFNEIFDDIHEED